MIEVRKFRQSDAADLAEIFHQAVQIGAASRYSAQQRAAWSPNQPSPDVWASRLEGFETLVAERDSKIDGFMSIRSDGYLDLAFVRPDAMGTGVADALLAITLNLAHTRGLTALSTHASHQAKSFFTRHGWTHQETQEIERSGVKLTNHRMKISIS